MEEDLQIAHLDVKAIKKILHPASSTRAQQSQSESSESTRYQRLHVQGFTLLSTL